MDLVREVQRQLNFPGIQQLLVGVQREAARRNVPAPTRAQVAEAVRTSAERQVFKAPKSGQAAVWALSKNSYWQVDLASFEHLGQVKLNTDHLYCIVATDVYSRYIRVQPIQEKKAQDTAAGFRLILQRAGAANKPRSCGFDDGGEWKGAFADLMRTEGIEVRTKSDAAGGINQLAVVDRSMQAFRAAMARRLLADRTSHWVPRAQSVADGLNEATTSATGAPPSA